MQKALTILVVEDEPVNLQVLELMLAALGHLPTAVASGRAALDELQARRFDLVMTDLHMPDMDGQALLAAMRLDRAGADVPAVAVTADVMSHPPEHYLAAGFAGYLSKPLMMPALAQALERFGLGLPAVAGRLPLRRAS